MQGQNLVSTPYWHGGRNWLDYVLVIALLAIALAPFVLGLGYVIPATLVHIVGVPEETSSEASTPKSALEWVDKGPIEHLTGVASRYTADETMILKLMPIAVLLLSASLGLLFWAMSSSTTPNLLAQMGARLGCADGPEQASLRSIERFSASTGISPPKLYIVHSSFPTTFSGATDAQNSMIAISSGALDLLNQRELDALMGHELAHVVNRDSRLDAILASLAVITEYPLRLFRKHMSSDSQRKVGWRRRLVVLEMALSPLGLYLLVISPVLNRLIGALVVRGRELNADANAALLTGDPEGLACAITTIGGVNAALGKSKLPSLPIHGWLSERIEHVMGLYAMAKYDGVQEAFARGKKYVADRPGMTEDTSGLVDSADHLASLNQGSVMGRVYRLMSSESVLVLEKAWTGALVVARVQPGALLVAFDTPGPMRQVNTAAEVFGYIGRDVPLQAMPGMLPQEVYDPRARAAAEEALRRQGPFTPHPAVAAAPTPGGLTRQQLWITIGFGTAVFACTTILLFVLAR
jgi:Zn-dependent protease with chaperone function